MLTDISELAALKEEHKNGQPVVVYIRIDNLEEMQQYLKDNADAFFDENGGLTRFDALGGASALFFIEENDTYATVNKTDSKMLSATFKDGDIERIYYYESPKNDGYPVVQLANDEKLLKGFNWQPEKRPADRNAVTPLSLRPSERKGYSS